MPKIICIDPGHGGSDPGAMNTKGRKEADDNLKLALAVKEELVAQGHAVVLTHTGLNSTVKMSLEDRRKVATVANADLFISLHRNGHTDNSANGVEIWIRNTAYTHAATEVLEQVMEASLGEQKNRGLMIGDYLILYNIPMPAMLLELGFVTNAKDNELFDQRFKHYVTSIATGILFALGEPYIDPATVAVRPKPLYRVQVGAFGVKENAENFLETVRKMGLEAFLVAPETAKEGA